MLPDIIVEEMKELLEDLRIHRKVLHALARRVHDAKFTPKTDTPKNHPARVAAAAAHLTDDAIPQLEEFLSKTLAALADQDATS